MRLCYSALDLRHYVEESNKTWHSERIYIVVVHLGIGFLARRKMSPWDLFENCNFSFKIELSFSALDLLYYWEESNETLYRGRIYIVVVHLGIGFPRAAKNVPNGTYSLFRARSPILLGYMHLGKILSSWLKMYLQDLI